MNEKAPQRHLQDTGVDPLDSKGVCVCPKCGGPSGGKLLSQRTVDKLSFEIFLQDRYKHIWMRRMEDLPLHTCDPKNASSLPIPGSPREGPGRQQDTGVVDPMDSKVLCLCPKCEPNGGKLLSQRTVDKHNKEARVKRMEDDRLRTSDPKNAPLFPGSEVTVQQAATKILSLHEHFPEVNQGATSEILRILHHFILPDENGLPDSFTAAKKIVTTCDACPEDHVASDGP
ncbi:uncharacterized protein LOC119737810 [Patiria miniata]|uniref:Uncharacterized protein n=1 Tax=Patiria miniata TaxID=46514 RepID=A0A914AXW8_PATMI|nr:uncharacterized protein LOC119737810 [Patiria miniata]